MKIYKEKKKEIKKSWSITLKPSQICHQCPAIKIIDTDTGEQIDDLIRFTDWGSITRVQGIKDILEKRGYDPHEHNNTWDDDGKIIIK